MDVLQARARNDAEEALCIFCPVAGGALKRTEDGRWGHVVCVLWNPTIRVRSIAKMEPIENYVQALQQAADRRKSGHGICSVCHDPHGLTIPCRAERSHGCLVRLHPLCAWYHGNYMSVRSVVGPDDQVSGAFSCYCDAHSSGAYFQAWLSQQPQALQQVHSPALFSCSKIHSLLNICTSFSGLGVSSPRSHAHQTGGYHCLAAATGGRDATSWPSSQYLVAVAFECADCAADADHSIICRFTGAATAFSAAASRDAQLRSSRSVGHAQIGRSGSSRYA
jgi:hypothetical protein